jgi:hypothetical protein
MKPSGFEDIFISKILHFIQGAGLLNESAEVLHKTSIMVKVHGSLSSRPSIFYSTWAHPTISEHNTASSVDIL